MNRYVLVSMENSVACAAIKRVQLEDVVRVMPAENPDKYIHPMIAVTYSNKGRLETGILLSDNNGRDIVAEPVRLDNHSNNMAAERGTEVAVKFAQSVVIKE